MLSHDGKELVRLERLLPHPACKDACAIGITDKLLVARQKTWKTPLRGHQQPGTPKAWHNPIPGHWLPGAEGCATPHLGHEALQGGQCGLLQGHSLGLQGSHSHRQARLQRPQLKGQPPVDAPRASAHQPWPVVAQSLREPCCRQRRSSAPRRLPLGSACCRGNSQTQQGPAGSAGGAFICIRQGGTECTAVGSWECSSRWLGVCGPAALE